MSKNLIKPVENGGFQGAKTPKSEKYAISKKTRIRFFAKVFKILSNAIWQFGNFVEFGNF